MKNYTLALILLLNYLSISAQELPELIPPPEDAFQFTKYGDVPVNESSGRINLSIPLFNFQSGGLELPIGLSYIGNGVKVNQYPTRTGMNWTLHAGGVITRTVKSLPDDNSQNYYLSNMDLSAMDIQDFSSDAQLLNQLTEGQTYDTERDEFSFSFFGYSGIFFFDDNFIPTSVDRSSNLKIEIDGAFPVDEKINITTPDGTKYFFGGDEVGISRLRDNDGNEIVAPTTTAYYLYKVQDLYGNITLFEYDEYGKQEISSITQSISYQSPLADGNWFYGECVLDPDPVGNCDLCSVGHGLTGCYSCPPPNNTSVNPTLTTQVFNQSINKKLNRIYTINNGTTKEVVFNDSQFTSGGIYQLSNLTYKENNLIIDSVDFNYLEPNNSGNTKRFFLEEVILDSHLSSGLDDQKKIYVMEYNSPEDLPSQFSYSQDHFGYYNAKPNTTLVPQNNHFYFSEYNNVLADKNPVFDEAKKGSLSQITYPTKGYTVFDYEAPKILGANKDVSLRIYHNEQQLIPDHIYLDQHTTDDPNISGDLGALGNQNIEFTVKIDLQPGYVEKHTKIVLTVEDLTSSTSTNQHFSLGIPTNNVTEPTTIVHDYSFSLIDGHHYTFKLSFLDTQYMDNSWAAVNARAFFSYTKQEEVDGHGVRIKSISSYTQENEIASYKRYYYKQAKYVNTLGSESSILNHNPTEQIYTERVYQKCLWGDLSCVINQLDYSVLKYQSSQGSPYSDNQAHYKYVTVSYGGDDFENGGIEKEFYFSGGNTYSIYQQPNNYLVPNNIQSNIYGNLNYQNGKLVRESHIGKYKDANKPLRIVRKTEYDYDYATFSFLPNFVGHRIPSCQSWDDVDNLLLGSYSVNIFNNHILQEKTTEYADPLPLNANNDSGYNKVVITTDYEYGDLAGLPIKVTTTGSDGNQQIIRTYYPDQIDSNTPLNLNPILSNSQYDAINNLKTDAEHRVDLPIQIENYIKKGNNNEELLSATRNLYGVENGLTELSSVHSSKDGSDFVERIIYHRYDNDGNPVEISKSDGTRIAYVWNANHQPIVKAVNANYDDVINNLSSLRSVLLGAQITTYTYTIPQNLLSSVTDPRGYVTTYHYDDFNRLEYVKDADGNILSENDYNYRPQPQN